MLASKPMINATANAAEQQDAVAEHQLVAAGVHLAGQVAVLGEDRGQHREAVEGGVGGEDEDGRGGRLVEVEQDRVAAEHRAAICEITDGLPLGWARR